jgi:hypothetical protein
MYVLSTYIYHKPHFHKIAYRLNNEINVVVFCDLLFDEAA